MPNEWLTVPANNGIKILSDRRVEKWKCCSGITFIWPMKLFSQNSVDFESMIRQAKIVDIELGTFILHIHISYILKCLVNFITCSCITFPFNINVLDLRPAIKKHSVQGLRSNQATKI